MKKYVLLVAMLATAKAGLAQHTELIGRAGLSLFRFGGADAQPTSFVNYSDSRGYDSGYTNSPYGSGWGTGAGLGGRVQRVGKHAGLLAFDLGYDWVQSRTQITDLYYSTSIGSNPHPATGTTYLRTQNITGFLGLGHRFTAAAVSLDVLAGPEVAAVFHAREHGSGTYDGTTDWSSGVDRGSRLPVDARLRADLTVWYQRIGLLASYSQGFLNYQSGLVGGSREVYGRTLRLGAAYRLRRGGA